MENNLMVLTIFLVVAVFITFIIGTHTKIKIAQIESSKPETERKPSKKKSDKLTQEEFFKLMDFMVQYQIIDNTQYNRIIAKSLPFLE
jgi:uncharacterized membrane protein